MCFTEWVLFHVLFLINEFDVFTWTHLLVVKNMEAEEYEKIFMFLNDGSYVSGE